MGKRRPRLTFEKAGTASLAPIIGGKAYPVQRLPLGVDGSLGAEGVDGLLGVDGSLGGAGEGLGLVVGWLVSVMVDSFVKRRRGPDAGFT